MLTNFYSGVLVRNCGQSIAMHLVDSGASAIALDEAQARRAAAFPCLRQTRLTTLSFLSLALDRRHLRLVLPAAAELHVLRFADGRRGNHESAGRRRSLRRRRRADHGEPDGHGVRGRGQAAIEEREEGGSENNRRERSRRITHPHHNGSEPILSCN